MEEEEVKEIEANVEKCGDNSDRESNDSIGELTRQSVEEILDDSNGDASTNNLDLPSVDPTISVADDMSFEHVSLKDQEENNAEEANRNSSPEPGNADTFSSGVKGNSSFSSLSGPDSDSYSAPEIPQDHVGSSPGTAKHHGHVIRQSSSSTSLDSGLYGDVYFSPIDSPQKSRPKAAMPNVSPELLHLVDSAIMGKPESLEKLKNIVSGTEIFPNGEEIDSIAVLVVDSLLATMGGVECFDDEDNNPPSVMLNSRAAIVAGELIPWLPFEVDVNISMSPRTRMVRGLLAILRACCRNRAMCSTAGLLGVLLQTAERLFTGEGVSDEKARWDGMPLCYCIQYLAAHSLSVIDLHKWLLVIRQTLNSIWASRLTLSLEKAMESKEAKGPTSTFEFDGESSGLLGPGESRWPFTNGYAFATWIYIESFADTLNTAAAAAAIAAAAAAKSGKSSAMSAAAAASALAGEGTAHMPRLFSFLSADNQGIEAYFHAQFLVVESGSGKGRKSSLHFTYAFKPQCWYFIGLEHTSRQGLLGKAESEHTFSHSLYAPIFWDWESLDCFGGPANAGDVDERIGGSGGWDLPFHHDGFCGFVVVTRVAEIWWFACWTCGWQWPHV